ncbi:MAG: DUF2779 domain-containing protein [Candidatus Saelkia tenebricola]|nr:DUF2779 domain-containing protein [Candidatus Saelkia tenebricola]
MAYSKLLTKSKYLIGLQCPKYLWTKYNEPDKIPDFDLATQFRFQQGQLVGDLAKRLYPQGIDIPKTAFMTNINQTKELLKQRNSLFEAGILTNNLYSRIDILNPAEDDSWDIIEVKSTTRVKKEHINDVAFQRYCLEKSGLKIKNCFLVHINNEYIKHGEIDPLSLFSIENISYEVEENINTIEENIANMFKTIDSKKCPDTPIGQQCDKPYQCPLKYICWSFLPTGSNVFNLYRGKTLAFDLLDMGILDIKDIPDDFILSEKQTIQLKSYKEQTPYVNKEALREFVSKLEYPLYFLDFETINPAIPIYDLSRPYEYIPFQYVLYVIREEGVKPDVYAYLAQGEEDPRIEVLKNLKKLLGLRGSIIAYNANFEINVLRKSSEVFTQYQDWFDEIESRFSDLLMPFRSFFYHHPSQQGSNSLKKVLPVLTKDSYKDMEIADGGEASIQYYTVTFNKDTDEKKRRDIYASLEKYCDLDTRGMVDILKRLQEEGGSYGRIYPDNHINRQQREC